MQAEKIEPNIGASPPVRGGTSEALVVGAIVLVGISLRLVFLSQWADTPLFKVPVGDELNFHQTALGLLGLDQAPSLFLYQPLYSFYLTLFYALFGVSVSAVKTLQLIIGAGGILVAYGLGRELGGRWTGRLAACIVALYQPLVFFEGQLLAPVLCVPATAGALWCTLVAGKQERLWLIVPAGVLLGLGLMGRPNLAVVAVPMAMWLFSRPWTWARRTLGAGLFTLSVFAGCLPAFAHNLASGHGFILVSPSGGHSFFIGNNPQATGDFHVPRGMRIDDSSHAAYQSSLAAVAESELGKKLEPAEVSSYWFGRGLEFWVDQPVQAMALAGKKLLLAVSSDERPIHHSLDFGREVAPVLGWLIGFGVLFPFAVMGVALGIRRRRGTGLLAVCALTYLSTLVAFYVADRYRILLLPMLAPLAGLGMLELYRRARRAGLRIWLPAVGLLAICFALTQLAPSGSQARLRALTGGFNLMGKAEGDRGDLASAERYFRRAIDVAGPGHGAMPRVNLGLLIERQGDLQAAIDLYRQAAAMKSEDRFVRVRLAYLAERLGDLQEALKWWQEVASLQAESRRAKREIERLRHRLSPNVNAGPD